MTANKPTFCFYDHVINLSNILQIVSGHVEGSAEWLHIYWRDARKETSSPLRISRRESDLPKYFLDNIVRLNEEWHKYLLQGQKPVETAELSDTTDIPTQAENISAHVFDISNDLEQLESAAQSTNKRLGTLEDKVGANSMQLFNTVAAIKNMANGHIKMAEGARLMATRIAELGDKIESIDKISARVAELEDQISAINNADNQKLKECAVRIETALQSVDAGHKKEIDDVLRRINCDFHQHVVDCETAIENYEAATNTRIRDYLDQVKHVYIGGMFAALACIGVAIIFLLLSK